nr:SyfB [Porphyropsis coccinea]
MKISWKWLNQLINISDISPETLSEHLTLAGCEVEDITYCTILGKEDCIMDITSTPNRADLLSMIGIAKEIGTILGIEQHYIKTNIKQIEKQKIKINISNNIDCLKGSSIKIPYYMTYISNIQERLTPDFIKAPLIACGILPQENISDIANYIMLKWGQPLDLIDDLYINSKQEQSISLITNNQLISNKENDNKNIKTLITKYNNQLIGLAGIKIDEEHSIKKTTSNLLIKAIIVPPIYARNNSRYSGIRTESSIRHERGLNEETLELAFLDAICLIKEIYPQSNIDKVYHNIIKKEIEDENHIFLNTKKVRTILGPVISIEKKKKAYINTNKIITILNSLGCIVQSDENYLQVIVPKNRIHDLNREIDLIEEIARIHGFNSFMDKLPYFKKRNINSKRNLSIKEFKKRFRSLGITETIHYSLVSNQQIPIVQIKNPLINEYSSLRTTLMFNLLESFYNNYKQNNQKLNAFEIGRIFELDQEVQKINETEMVASIFGSKLIRKSWNCSLKPMNWFEAKGIIELLLEPIRHQILWTKKVNTKYKQIFHPGKCANITLNGQIIGVFGEIHPKLLKNYNFSNCIYGVELKLNSVIKHLQTEKNDIEFTDYSTFPVIVRDISFEVPLKTTVNSITNTIYNNKPKFLKTIELFDEYKGDKIATNKRSLTFRLCYQSHTKTLTAEEVEAVHLELKNTTKKLLDIKFR